MANPNERDHCRDTQANEDTQAILNRRRFLIASALAGAGIGAVAAGCDRDAQPLVCLEVEPEPGPCLTPKPPEKKPGTKPTTREPAPRPCLEFPPEPRPCLDPAPPPGARKLGTWADICLSIRRPKPVPGICLKPAPPKPKPKPCLIVPPRPKRKPEPRPCLSMPLPKPKTSPKKPEPRPCLSPREP